MYLFVFLCFLLSPWLCILILFPFFLSSGFVFVFYYTSISALSYVLFSPSTQDECSSIFHPLSPLVPPFYISYTFSLLCICTHFPFQISITFHNLHLYPDLNIANQQNVKLSWLLLLLSFLNPPFLTSHTPPNSYNTPDT